MKMLRIVIAQFTGMTEADWNDAVLKHETFAMSRIGMGHDGRALHVFIGCECSLSVCPQTDSQDNVIAPGDVRRSLEAAIEAVADAVAVSMRCQRSLRSPTPSVILLPDSDDERNWLNARNGIARQTRTIPAGCPRIPFTKLEDIQKDRPDGIALLAEALAHPHASGRFHELFRVFERAFRIDCGHLGTPLSTFLSSVPLGYTLDEVNSWIKIRGPITHADVRKTFLLERDAFPVIHRMEQAAFDVVFNKKTWRDVSTERVDRWRADWGTTDSQSGIYVTQGRDARPAFHLSDEYGVYPWDLSACFNNPPPTWWYGRKQSGPLNQKPSGIVEAHKS